MKRILFLLVVSALVTGCATQPRKVTNVYVVPPPAVNTYGNVKGITKSGSTELDKVEINFGINAAW